jgi:NAD+ synthase (glutamine-hydrolysing)
LLLGVHICEDAWYGEPGTFYHLKSEYRRDPIDELAAAGTKLMINLSASPFEIDKPHRRARIITRHIARHRIPFVFVNQVGGNDDLVFDGNSQVFNGESQLISQLTSFESDFATFDVTHSTIFRSNPPSPPLADSRPREADLLDALILGLKDYMRKSGFRDCVLGLSGGIDSALACYIAAAAAGPAHVHGLALPSRYSSQHSVSDAHRLAEAIGIDFEVVPIDAIHAAYEATAVVGADLASQPAGLADQNLQARIRGALVMIRSNRYGWLTLATGNKSELAVGYCTLYGDMAGGFAVLADVFKRDVYAVARYINEQRERREVIPQGSLTKAPSAELAPNQFDQDTLPPYPILDAILEGLIEREMSIETLSRQFPPETVRWVAGRLDRNEFKRRQMPPGIKLSHRAFGSGRRMPMAAKYDWEPPTAPGGRG